VAPHFREVECKACQSDHWCATGNNGRTAQWQRRKLHANEAWSESWGIKGWESWGNAAARKKRHGHAQHCACDQPILKKSPTNSC